MTDVTPVARSRPIQHGSERAMLESMLDFYRATVVNKVAGVSADGETAAVNAWVSVRPATVVRHLTGTGGPVGPGGGVPARACAAPQLL